MDNIKEQDPGCFDKICNFFTDSNGTSDLELQNILRDIDSLEKFEQSLIGLFWVTTIDKQVKFLSFVKPQIAAEVLRSGLNGAPRQASVALVLLKDSFKDLVDTLKEDIFIAAQGDSMKVSVEAGTLLLQEVPEFLIQEPWFIKRLCSVAESPVPVKERITLIQLLCRQANHHNYLQLEYYPDRNEVVDNLLSEEHHLALAFYLRSALNKWHPATGEPDNLAWLLEAYRKMKGIAEDNEGELTLKGQQGMLSLRSKLVLEAAVYEVAVAGADAIIRCINGPGGEHLWTKFTDFMEDKELAEELWMGLSRDPRALAILAEEMVLQPESFNLLQQEIVQFLSHGVLAAQHCLKEILKLCLNTAMKEEESSKLCLEKIGSEKDRLYPYAGELFEQIAQKV